MKTAIAKYCSQFFKLNVSSIKHDTLKGKLTNLLSWTWNIPVDKIQFVLTDDKWGKLSLDTGNKE